MFCLKLTSVSCKQTTRFYLKNAIRGLTSPSQTNDYAKTPEHFDIVISGGGMVGTSMACALGSDNLFKNLSIALIEASPQRGDYKMPPIHANRVCALSNKTIELLKSIDSYDFIQKHRFGNVHHMHVWDGKSDAFITFKNDSLSNLAIIVENDLIQASLSQNLSKYPNVKVFYSNQIKDIVEKTHSVELKMKDDLFISTKILIGSDGSNSFVREKAKFNVMRWNHDQMAIIATLKLAEKGENQTAWQRFLSTGPIALLPLSDEYSSLVWSIKTQYAKELMEIDDEKFVHRVNEAFISEATKNGLGTTTENFVQRGLDFIRNLNPSMEDILSDRELSQRQLPPKIDKVFVRSCFPLSFIHSSHYVKNRIALIGDAAHKIHPLAGQGVNLGFGDVVRLTECLRKNVKNGAEIGSEMYLKAYETERQREVLLKIAGIEAINKLYTDQGYLLQTPLMVLRTAGLTLSNRITPLKSFFVQEAMQ